jgi:hypothetical protein
VNAANGERLPSTIGGMIDLAFVTYAARVALYLVLGAAIVAVLGAIEYLIPAPDLQALALRDTILEWVDVLLLAYVVAVAALDVGGSVAGEPPPRALLLRGALARWPRVALSLILVQFIFDLTAAAGGFVGPVDVLTIALAPFVWLFWGVISLGPPLAALSTDRGAAGAVLSLLRAIGFSLHAANLPRLALIALVSVVPSMLSIVLGDWGTQHHVPHAMFWGSIPIDALTVAPLTALQTTFALDFVRRSPPSPPRR